MLIPAVLLACFAGTTTLELDPSLYVPSSIHSAPYTTMTEELTPIVLDFGGVEILWDDQTETFSAMVGGNIVNDLVTGTTGAGYPSFAGKFTTGGEATVFGYVVAEGAGGDYTVFLSIPNSSSLSFDISNPTGVNPLVNVARSCGCSDTGSLDCGPAADCNSEKSCGEDDGTCNWTDISS